MLTVPAVPPKTARSPCVYVPWVPLPVLLEFQFAREVFQVPEPPIEPVSQYWGVGSGGCDTKRTASAYQRLLLNEPLAYVNVTVKLVAVGVIVPMFTQLLAP